MLKRNDRSLVEHAQLLLEDGYRVKIGVQGTDDEIEITSIGLGESGDVRIELANAAHGASAGDSPVLHLAQNRVTFVSASRPELLFEQ